MQRGKSIVAASKQGELVLTDEQIKANTRFSVS